MTTPNGVRRLATALGVLALVATMALVLGLIDVLARTHDAEEQSRCTAEQTLRSARAALSALEQFTIQGVSPEDATAALGRWKTAQTDIVTRLEACR